MGFKNEDIINALLTKLQTDLPDALDAVELARIADPVTLPNPVTWFAGHNPDVIDLDSSAFPFVAVLSPGAEPVESRRATFGYQAQVVELYVDFFVVASDKATVNKIGWRYAEALVNVLESQAVIGGFQQRDYNPAVRLTEVMRHQVYFNDSDLDETTETDYIQGGRITVIISND